MDGREGDDRLEGGLGDDIYRYGLGDGSDIIYDTGGQDTLAFGAGISVESLTITRDATTVFINMPDGTGGESTLRFDQVFDFDGNLRKTAIERFTFADGSERSIQQLIAMIEQHSTGGDDELFGFDGDESFDGLAGDDLIAGGAGNDNLSGSEGSDTLQGAAGNDRLFGGNGADVLQGGEGDDTLSGEAGDDKLEGGKGADIYEFEAGWGSDWINNRAQDNRSTKDIIRFDEGVTPEDILARRTGDDLILTRMVSSDRIEIDRYFDYAKIRDSAIDAIHFVDGTQWTANNIHSMVITPTEKSDELYGLDSGEVLEGRGGDDIIRAHDGDDVLRGGEGNDLLYGDDGNDTLDGELVATLYTAARDKIPLFTARGMGMTSSRVEIKLVTD